MVPKSRARGRWPEVHPKGCLLSVSLLILQMISKLGEKTLKTGYKISVEAWIVGGGGGRVKLHRNRRNWSFEVDGAQVKVTLEIFDGKL